MKPFTGIIPHIPSQGLYGDCYRTALGCLLDLPPEQVPHFLDGDADDWIYQRDAWLADRGLGLVTVLLSPPARSDSDERVGLDAILASMEGINTGMHYLLCGDTIDGVGHTVVCCGGKVVHNPNANACPIVAPMGGTDYYELQFLVPNSMDAEAYDGGIIRVVPLDIIASEFAVLTPDEVEIIRWHRKRTHEARQLIQQDQSYAMNRITGKTL